MRRMADSVSVDSLPPGFDVYAGYVNGLYRNYDQIKAKFPDKPVIGITVNSHVITNCLDVEDQDATPQEAPPWAKWCRLNNLNPIVYCSLAIWEDVKNEFIRQEVGQPLYWIAAYPGPGPVMIDGAIGHQWIDRGPYDESVIADYIPGVDPAPVPDQGELMPVSPAIAFDNGQHVLQVSYGALFHKWWKNGQWTNEIVAGPQPGSSSTVQITLPNQTPQVAVISGQLVVTVEASDVFAYYFSLTPGQRWGAARLP